MRPNASTRSILCIMLACSASSMTTTGRRVAPCRPQSSLARKHLLSAGVALLAAAPLASRAKDFGCTEGEDDYFCLDGKLRAQNGLPAYRPPPKAKVDGAAAKERRLEAMRAQYRGARAGAAPAPAPPPGAAPPPA